MDSPVSSEPLVPSVGLAGFGHLCSTGPSAGDRTRQRLTTAPDPAGGGSLAFLPLANCKRLAARVLAHDCNSDISCTDGCCARSQVR